jgi:hypothetical protein
VLSFLFSLTRSNEIVDYETDVLVTPVYDRDGRGLSAVVVPPDHFTATSRAIIRIGDFYCCPLTIGSIELGCEPEKRSGPEANSLVP